MIVKIITKLIGLSVYSVKIVLPAAKGLEIKLQKPYD